MKIHDFTVADAREPGHGMATLGFAFMLLAVIVILFPGVVGLSFAAKVPL